MSYVAQARETDDDPRFDKGDVILTVAVLFFCGPLFLVFWPLAVVYFGMLLLIGLLWAASSIALKILEWQTRKPKEPPPRTSPTLPA